MALHDAHQRVLTEVAHDIRLTDPRLYTAMSSHRAPRRTIRAWPAGFTASMLCMIVIGMLAGMPLWQALTWLLVTIGASVLSWWDPLHADRTGAIE